MYLGERVKNAREALGLYQKDLATINLSRNLLSNIELNKTVLTPAKALILFKKIIDQSWIKDIHIDIHFDELLTENEEYQRLKKADATCKELHYIEQLDKEKIIQYFDETIYYDVLRTSNNGILDCYITYYLAEIFVKIEKLSKAQSYYFKALDYLVNYRIIDFIQQYTKCLYKVIRISLKQDQQSELLKYFKYLEFMYDSSYLEVPAKIYYNLALYSDMNNESQQAIKYLNIYIGKIDDPIDIVDAEIMQAIIYTTSNNVSKGISVYKKLLEQPHVTNDAKKMTLCISNIIYNTVHYNLSITPKSLVKYIDDLNDLTSKNPANPRQYRYFSSIAQGYYYLGELNKAHRYYSDSFNSIENDYDFHKVLTVIDESLDLFMKLEKIDELITRLLNIKYEKLNPPDIPLLFYLISKIQNYILINDNVRVSFKYDFVDYLNNIEFRR